MLLSRAEWDEYLKAFPDAHLLQMGAWGDLKGEFGWLALRIGNKFAGAQILFRKLPFGLTIAYLPKGPVGEPDPAFWQEVDRVCRSNNAVFLKVELDQWNDESTSSSSLPINGSIPSVPIQPIQTIVVDLSGGEESVLARMKQKTRYNINLAEKKEIEIVPWRDFHQFGQMIQTTSERDRFGVHHSRYYQLAYEHFSAANECELFCAQYQGKPLAAVMVFRHGKRAWYLYGASSNEERNRMPAYLVQWRAIQWALEHGCTEYDLWGIPDSSEKVLEEQFIRRSDGLWGVYRFKRGFGGEIRRAVGARDRIFSKSFYSLYRFFMNFRNRNGAME